MSSEPFDLDKQRGMAAQKATDLRRVLAEVDTATAARLGEIAQHLGNEAEQRVAIEALARWEHAVDRFREERAKEKTP